MRKEKSCGAVVFTRDGGGVRYIIIRQTNGVYCFPKGHMEVGESEEETALREIREEVGLNVTLVAGFRKPDFYKFNSDGKEIIHKEVVYFLGEFAEQTPIHQETEVSDVYLLSFDEALATLQFDGMKRILCEADEFLKK